MPRVLLAVDLSNQVYKAAAAHSTLTDAEGTFTGGLYGFLVTIAKIIRDVHATDCVICMDSKPYRRSLVYPQYKMLRKDSQDPELKKRFDISKPQVIEACEVIGIPFLERPGFECDDCIASIVLQHACRYDEIYAASNDSDLWQLFHTPWFKVYRRDLNDCMHLDALRREHGLTPEEFLLASALQGTHNEVEGIKGVGPKTSARIVKEPALLRTYMERHGDLIKRNLSLITLPHHEFPAIRAVPAPTQSFDVRSLYRFLARWDIKATQSMLDSFSRVCP